MFTASSNKLIWSFSLYDTQNDSALICLLVLGGDRPHNHLQHCAWPLRKGCSTLTRRLCAQVQTIEQIFWMYSLGMYNSMSKSIIKCSLIYQVELKFQGIGFNSQYNFLHGILKMPDFFFCFGVDYFKVFKTVRDKIS